MSDQDQSFADILSQLLVQCFQERDFVLIYPEGDGNSSRLLTTLTSTADLIDVFEGQLERLRDIEAKPVLTPVKIIRPS